MLRNNYRQINIIKNLLENDSFVTAEQLATITNTSVRTVKRDISRIKPYLPEYGATVISKRNQGYKLIITDNDRFDEFVLQVKIGISNMGALKDELISDKKLIIMTLLSQDSFTPIEIIANQLYHSRSTFINKLDLVRIDLQSFNLSIASKAKKGIRLSGSEINKRILIMELLTSNYHFKENSDYPEYFLSLFKEKNYVLYRDIILDTLTQWDISIYRYSLDKVVNFFILSSNRIAEDKTITLKKDLIDLIIPLREYQCACDMLEKLNANWTIDEKVTLSIIVIESERVRSETFGNNEIVSEAHEIYGKIRKQIIESYGVDLNHPPSLEKAIIDFLIPIIVKNRFGIAHQIKYSKNMSGTSLQKEPLFVDFSKTFMIHLAENYHYVIDINDFSFLLRMLSASFESLDYEYKKVKINISTQLPSEITYSIVEKWMKVNEDRIEHCTFYPSHELDYRNLDFDVLLTDMMTLPYTTIKVPKIYINYNPLMESAFSKSLSKATLYGYKLDSIAEKFSKITHLYQNFPNLDYDSIASSLAIKYSQKDINELNNFFSIGHNYSLRDGLLFFFIPYNKTNKEFVDIYKLSENIKIKSKRDSFETIISHIIVSSVRLTITECKGLSVILRTFNRSEETLTELFTCNDIAKFYKNILLKNLDLGLIKSEEQFL